jgi:hypothetical protein
MRDVVLDWAVAYLSIAGRSQKAPQTIGREVLEEELWGWELPDPLDRVDIGFSLMCGRLGGIEVEKQKRQNATEMKMKKECERYGRRSVGCVEVMDVVSVEVQFIHSS